MLRSAAIGLACVATPLCSGGCALQPFACASDADCRGDGSNGVCQPESVCSFPDGACDSGQRYGGHSGAMSGQCVPGEGSSGGVADSGGSTSTMAPSHESTGSGTVTSGSSSGDEGASSTGTTTGTPVPSEPLLWFEFEALGPDGFDNGGSLGGIASCNAMTCPEVVLGRVGNGAQFDGVDDCAMYGFAEALRLEQGFSLAAWVQRQGTGYGFMGVVTKPVGDLPYNSWRLAVTVDADDVDIAHFHVGLVDDMGGTLETPVPDLMWTHVVGTWDGMHMTLWQDGQLVGEVDNSLYEVDEQPVLLGCDDEHGDIGIARYFHGALDEVRLYDRVLAPEEIALLANGP